MKVKNQNINPEIQAFENKARKNGISDTTQENYAFYDKADSEFYVVSNILASNSEKQARIEFIPLILNITEVTISRPPIAHTGGNT